MKKSEAVKLRAIIEQAVSGVDDKTASMGAGLFCGLKENGALVPAGTRINWKGEIKKAAVDLWDTRANNPDNAPDLWADIGWRDGLRLIPETIAAAAAFALDETGWWQGRKYRSKLDANVYTPDQYPEGWQLLPE